MKDKLTPQDSQTLTAYLDDRLSPREKAYLEARLQQQSELRDELEALKQTRLMLRALPKRRAPRNFTLSPAMAPRRPMPQFFPVFRFASALAGVLLVAAFLGQYVLGGRTSTSQNAAPAAFAVSGNKMLATSAQADTANKAAIIILWGTPTDPSIAGGLGGARGGGGPGFNASAPETNNSANASNSGTASKASTQKAGVLSTAQPMAVTPSAPADHNSPPVYLQPESTQTPMGNPTEEATEAPLPAAPQAPSENSAQATPTENATLSGSPILGVQPPGEQNTPEPTVMIPAQEPPNAPVPIWGWIEAGLVMAGVTLALAAYYFYRKEK
jgi:hypothetical protein